MTLLAAFILGGVLTGAAFLTLSYLDHLAQCEGNDDENYPSE